MNKPLPNTYRQGPDSRGRFGPFGGRFVAETLMPLILEVEAAYEAAKKDPDQYRDLVVRVAVYSAFFAELSPEAQDDIIARTEHVM